MFRAISSHTRPPLRFLPQTLTYFPQQPSSSSIPPHSPFKIPVNPSQSTLSNPPFSLISTLSSPFRHSQQLQRHEGPPADVLNRDPTGPPRLFVVQPRLRPAPNLKVKLDEALNLANSLEEQRDGFFDTELWEKELPPHVIVQNPASRSRRADTYFGPGTVDTVKCHLNAMESKDGVDAVFVNAILTGIQQRNLERAWGKPVLDRVGLIIEIFNAHAYTKEAKLQAELAALMYKRSRLVRVRGLDGRFAFGTVGEAEVVSARGRGSGGRGFISGAGETELQLQRRRILERRKQLLYEIKEVRRTRALQRAARRRHGGENGQVMATVAVVGYTNAGKSTLVSALSNSDLYSDDRLFATVDPKLRSVILPSGRKVIFSDTVGFISDLPVQLVEAFHATLEEVVEADLLVHVLDSNAPNLDEHRQTVLQVLKQIGVSELKLQNMIEVWNKVDLQEEIGADECLEDGEDDEIGSFSGAEDDEDDTGENLGSDISPGDHEESTDDLKSDYSDGWLLSGDEQEKTLSEMGSETLNDQQSTYLVEEDERKIEESCHSQSRSVPDVKISAVMEVGLQELSTSVEEEQRKIEESCDSQSRSVPDVKTSAVMGVGLQELLELIDTKIKSQNVIVERNMIDRKWRPPRAEDDDGMAIEQ